MGTAPHRQSPPLNHNRRPRPGRRHVMKKSHRVPSLCQNSSWLNMQHEDRVAWLAGRAMFAHSHFYTNLERTQIFTVFQILHGSKSCKRSAWLTDWLSKQERWALSTYSTFMYVFPYVAMLSIPAFIFLGFSLQKMSTEKGAGLTHTWTERIKLAAILPHVV